MTIRPLATALASLLLTSACSPTPSDRSRDTSGLHDVPAAELRPAADAKTLLDSARALMQRDGFVALVTVDSSGQPRVRTVRAYFDSVDSSRPASGVTVWIKTRLTTRKVDQIRRHPQVTLYFNDDTRASYASIMGTAVVHTDPNEAATKRHFDSADAKFFWPDYPRGFVMIEVQPKWLEYIGPGIENDSTTWRPQSVVFK